MTMSAFRFFVAYKHRDLTLDYTVDCADEKTSRLASESGQSSVWRIEITPHRQPHELIWVDGKVFEDQKIVFSGRMQIKVGGGPAMLTLDPDSAYSHSLWFEAKLLNQLSNGASN